MSTLLDLRNARLSKLERLHALGVDPFPSKSYRNTANREVLSDFDALDGNSVVVAGRIIAIRRHGSLMFLDVQDATGTIQYYLRADNYVGGDHSDSELTFEELDLLDVGDFVEGHGTVTKTRRGEISVAVSKLRILTKALRPLPLGYEGFRDKEVRLRRRYVDLAVNRDVFERFIRRSRFWEAHREFFKQHGFIEINVPVLEHIPGGGDAKPFVTHMDAIDQDFYLRISQELPLKRLIGGGYEKVYEIGPRFRNEGVSEEHLPEHISMEFYWAYADYQQGMQFIKDLYNFILDYVYGKNRVFSIRGFTVDFSKDWELLDFGEVFENEYGVDPYAISLGDVKALLTKYGVTLSPETLNVPRGVDALWKRLRKTIAGPAFLINHPKYLSPLQKPSRSDPRKVERFQPIIAGSELGNGWSEVNDPLDQFERFMEQQRLRDAGDEEAQFLDIDFVEMLEYGMPPTFGYGHSERLFWFLEDVSAREGVPFPQLKFDLDPTTREIYNLGDIYAKK